MFLKSVLVRQGILTSLIQCNINIFYSLLWNTLTCVCVHRSRVSGRFSHSTTLQCGHITPNLWWSWESQSRRTCSLDRGQCTKSETHPLLTCTRTNTHRPVLHETTHVFLLLSFCVFSRSQDEDFPPRDDFSDVDQLRVGNDGIFMLAFFSEFVSRCLFPICSLLVRML